MKYPRIVKNILENIGNALKLHSESNKSDESSIIIKSILELSLKVIFMLPPNKISEILSSQSSLVQYIADLIVFQGENCDEIIPYLEEIDKQVIKEYDYAKKCVESLEASIKIKQMLAHEKLLPITSPQMLHNAIDFFGRVMPILEFQQDLPIQNFVLDLNVYSFLLENDSNMASRFKDCQDLLLALLSSPIELVRQNTIQAVKSSVTDVIEMKGIAQGILRNQVIKKFLLKEPVIGYIVVNCPELHCVIPRILEKLEDYGILLPYFTVLQGLSGLNPDLGGLVHTLTNQEAASQPLRFIRDLFSKNPSNRILASQILRKCNSPDTIQSE